MPQPRATAQQAIEVLKVHQLRKENVIIFDEVKHLRVEVTSRANELNAVLKQVNDLRSQLGDAIDKSMQYEKKVDVVQATVNDARTEIEELRRDHEQGNTDLNKALTAQQTTAQKADAATKRLCEDVARLQKHIEDADNKTVEVFEDLNLQLNAKAEQQAVIELEHRLDKTVHEFRQKVRTAESVSRVTDTAEQLVDQNSGTWLESTAATLGLTTYQISIHQAHSGTTRAYGNPLVVQLRCRGQRSKNMAL